MRIAFASSHELESTWARVEVNRGLGVGSNPVRAKTNLTEVPGIPIVVCEQGKVRGGDTPDLAA